MADVRLKDPHSDFVAVVGSPIEAANLRARGYTDVDDEPTDAGPQATLASPQESGSGASGTENTAGGEGEQQTDAGQQSTTSPEPKTPRAGRSAPKQ